MSILRRSVRGVFSFIGRVRLWLLEIRSSFLALSVVLLACVIAFAFHTEKSFRYCGLILQLMGLYTVVRGIRDTRRLFGQPTLPERLRRWLTRRPKFRQSTNVAIALVDMAAAVSSAEGELWLAMRDDAPVDQQLRALKANLLTLNQRVIKQAEKFAADIREDAQKLENESAARTRRDTELETLMRSAQTGGLDVSIVGLVWLASGLVLTTISIEGAENAEKLSKWMFGG